MHARTFTICQAFSLALATVALGCGGGGGGDSVTCADVAAKAVSCNALDSALYLERVCNRFSCSAKQQVLECMMKASCGSDSGACLDGTGCSTGTDCGTVADAASECARSRSESLDGDATYAACVRISCPVDAFFAAIDCAAGFATTCNPSWKADVNTCFTSQGCAALFQ